MPLGLDKLKHIVVLMMENRSFDHMLGALKATDARIDGLDGTQSNPDTSGKPALAQPLAEFQGQLDPDPDHHFPGVDLQIFNGETTPDRVATMQGFVKSYFSQRRDVKHSRKIMYYFTPDKLPVLTTLATEFAVFNRWFASIPGPTLCNRAFAHYGTSFGHVGMELFYANAQFKSIYQRLESAGKTAKIYYFDTKSSSLEVVNLLQHQPQFFGTFQQFLDDCGRGHAARLLLHRAELQRPRRRQRRHPRVGSASRTITCRKANGSSRRSTTRSGRMPRSGNRPRC